jgi:homoserine kinase
MKGSVRVFAPATVGNVACGFDVLGLALESPGDEVVVHPGEHPGVEIVAITGDGGRLPRGADRNAAGLAARAVLRVAGVEGTTGLRLELHKGLPLSSGLGGSAASSVAAAVAVDAFLGAGLPRETLLACAGEGESGGAGAAHLDNAAPCLFGGICLVLPGVDGGAPRVVELPVPDGLSVAVVHPHLEVETAEARRLLGDTVRLADAVLQWGNTAGFVAALYQGDLELLGRTLVDHVAEPRRAGLVPGFPEARQAALEAGALGGSLSGSGPSVFALCGDLATATRAGEAMAARFTGRGTPCDIHISPVARQGARLLDPEE